jgi:hypothetical protein
MCRQAGCVKHRKCGSVKEKRILSGTNGGNLNSTLYGACAAAQTRAGGAVDRPDGQTGLES